MPIHVGVEAYSYRGVSLVAAGEWSVVDQCPHELDGLTHLAFLVA